MGKNKNGRDGEQISKSINGFVRWRDEVESPRNEGIERFEFFQEDSFDDN